MAEREGVPGTNIILNYPMKAALLKPSRGREIGEGMMSEGGKSLKAAWKRFIVDAVLGKDGKRMNSEFWEKRNKPGFEPLVYCANRGLDYLGKRKL